MNEIYKQHCDKCATKDVCEEGQELERADFAFGMVYANWHSCEGNLDSPIPYGKTREAIKVDEDMNFAEKAVLSKIALKNCYRERDTKDERYEDLLFENQVYRENF